MSLLGEKATPGLKLLILVAAAAVFAIDPPWRESDPLRMALGFAMPGMWLTLVFAPAKSPSWRVIGWVTVLVPLLLLGALAVRAVAG